MILRAHCFIFPSMNAVSFYINFTTAAIAVGATVRGMRVLRSKGCIREGGFVVMCHCKQLAREDDTSALADQQGTIVA